MVTLFNYRRSGGYGVAGVLGGELHPGQTWVDPVVVPETGTGVPLTPSGALVGVDLGGGVGYKVKSYTPRQGG